MIKSDAIVLHALRYREDSYMVHLLTREQGQISFLVKGHKRKSPLPVILMQPFSLLTIVYQYQTNREFQYIKESSTSDFLNDIPYNPLKNSMVMFLSEMLYRSLKETHKEPELFDFIKHSILYLDKQDKGFANFHLVFLIKLTHFLGFFPNLSQFQANVYFDMQNSEFTEQPTNIHTLNQAQTEAFAQLMRMDYENMYLFELSRTQRNEILEQILIYYKLHLPEFHTIRSLEILQQLFV